MIFVYFFFLICSFLFYIQYEGAFSFYLFCFAVGTPIVFFTINLYLKARLSISFASDKRSAVRNSNVPIDLVINNPTIFPVSNCKIKIKFRSELTGSEDHFVINTPIFPRNEQKLTFKLYCKHYGSISLEIQKATIYDQLKLSRFKLIRRKMKFGRTTVSILPDFQIIDNPISNYSHLGMESSEYSKIKKGDDPSEIFDLHTYNEGDKISRIHWKLSAKQDELIVKDYSLPITNAITIAADLSGCSFSNEMLDVTDLLLDTAAALSLHLAENNITHRLIWTDSNSSGYEIKIIDSIESCRAAVNKLVNLGAPSSVQGLTKIMTEIDEKPNSCAHLIYCTYFLTKNKITDMSTSGFAYRYTAISPNVEDGVCEGDNIGIYDLKAGAAVPSLIDGLVI
ncbi:MAG: DUF58 domain-containing protein [Ruminococcus sp.]|nr:DUF58 domain-containing protein [Ruminococcus sp.]